jgi:hypothetical protein
MEGVHVVQGHATSRDHDITWEAETKQHSENMDKQKVIRKERKAWFPWK